ncbi:MAG: hypothetical protein HOQ04_01735 [Pseudarthrobacter sp.]|nr:hypothetical protein [Pseudarthrobacter sp.]
MRRQGLLLAWIATTALTSGCGPGATACPAIAQATAVSVTITAGYAAQVGTLHLKACQDGNCKEGDLELRAGTAPADQGCNPEGACSATASPDGTRVGTLMLDTLTESAMTVTATGTGADGSALPVRTLRFQPRAVHPFGEQCGKFLTAAVTLDSAGLRESA